MEYNEIGEVAGVPIRVPVSDDYRTCSECSQDCEPDVTFGSDEHGARIAFVCAQHGIQNLIDPFEDQR